ncbi:MAG: hypothetical protein EXX96DRAFT_489868 [Benjaminiella poitrasii]|nr:MAG: hypothetical protein EXX96DRAFT_489868 [Benjaminiella poitrasii]
MIPSNNEWTILEKLLLTQAVYKYGENMWFQVARVLKQHSLIQQQEIQRPSDFYSQKNCSLQYYLLVENLEAEKNDIKRDMPVVIQLARQLYTQRVEEIKKRLQRDQEEFSQLATEIHSIKSGQWDQKLEQHSNFTSSTKEFGKKNIALTIDTIDKQFKTSMSDDTTEIMEENDNQQQKIWRKTISILWQTIANHKNGPLFMKPVKSMEASLYNKVTIKTTCEFERDIILMLTNSLMYNKEGTEAYLLALEMLKDVKEQFEIFKSADISIL